MIAFFKKASLKWSAVGLLVAVAISLVALTNARADGTKIESTGIIQPPSAGAKGQPPTAGAKGNSDAETVMINPEDLQNVIAIEVRRMSDGQKTTTDHALVEPVKSALAQARFVTNNPQPPGVEGGGYDVILKLSAGDPILLSYWPGGGSPNLRNQRETRWWVIDGFDEVMKPLLPPQYLSLDQVIEIGKRIDPTAEWWPRYVAKGNFDVQGDLVWLLDGITRSGERLEIYLDPMTGKELKRNPPESTGGAVEVVKEFYRLVARGDYAPALKLLHPTARAQEFDLQQGQPGPGLAQVLGAAWYPDGWKSPVTMTRMFDVVGVKVKLSDGTERNIVAAKDRDGYWRLVSSR